MVIRTGRKTLIPVEVSMGPTRGVKGKAHNPKDQGNDLVDFQADVDRPAAR